MWRPPAPAGDSCWTASGAKHSALLPRRAALGCTLACRRVLGSLKVCSRSLFFVPRDVQQPITRIPFATTSAIEA